MKIVLTRPVFFPKPLVDFLRMKMGACVYYALGYATSVVIPDQYDSGDNIQILATYLYNCDALSDEDAAIIVKNSHFGSITELVDYWRSDVDKLIDVEGFE